MGPRRRDSSFLSVALATIALAGSAICSSARAMSLRVEGNQLILTGAVVGDEFPKIEAALSSSISIDTVVLRDSPGGDIATGYQVGELFREKRLRTAVSGYCYSSCSRMFLGGAVRVFTDDYPPEKTEVGFHGHYSNGKLQPDSVRERGLKSWIIKHSDGKADPELVDRWINIKLSRGMIRFNHPTLFKQGGVSAFLCQGDEPKSLPVTACEAIPKTAIELGIITSLEVVQSNDVRPARSGYAAIDDLGMLPLSEPQGVQEYESFLVSRMPRAFAVAPDGRYWAWNSGPSDSTMQALSRCAQRSQQHCRLYAVDDAIVWNPE
jgi:hypothetical protein